MTAAWSPPAGVAMRLVDGSLEQAFLVARLTFEPGTSLPSDVHHDHAETIFVLGGDVALAREGSVLRLDAASFPVAIPAGAKHSLVAGAIGADILSVLRRVPS